VRPSKNKYFLDIANEVGKRSTCLRAKLGAIIVDDEGTILSTGYNGPPRKVYNCCDESICLVDLLKKDIGAYDFCSAVHAEENAIINAARAGVSVRRAMMYLAVSWAMNENIRTYWEKTGPCNRCRRLLINAGIKQLITKQSTYSIKQLRKLETLWRKNVCKEQK